MPSRPGIVNVVTGKKATLDDDRINLCRESADKTAKPRCRGGDEEWNEYAFWL